MKKIWVCLLLTSLSLQNCREDNPYSNKVKEVENITEQNANDDKAIQKYLEDHYFTPQGEIKKFSSTDTSDDANKKLSELNPITLENGVVVILKENAQPTNGKTIGDTDVLRIMHRSTTFLSNKNKDGNVEYISEDTFANTIDNLGTPQKDPYFYYVKKNILESGKTEASKKESYYVIEGFKEGLKKMKAHQNLPDSESYNLQGVILVPSRAAYARDEHYLSVYRNRNFVFNLQVYSSETRTDAEK